MTEERQPPWEMTQEQADWATKRRDQESSYAGVSSHYFCPENDAEYWREVKRRKDEEGTGADGFNSILKRHKDERLAEVRQLIREHGRDKIGELTSEQGVALQDLALDVLEGNSSTG